MIIMIHDLHHHFYYKQAFIGPNPQLVLISTAPAP